MKLLMHICCSNCSSYPFEHFLYAGIDVKGFWYNPNIHPSGEYENRLSSVVKLQKLWSLDIEYEDMYGLKDFMEQIAGRMSEDRCSLCYALRLDATAKAAKKMGMDGFTTSLLISPFQKREAIIRTGDECGKKYSIAFYPQDFRPGWGTSVRLSKELGLYRQNYCGCIFSEMERYEGKKLKNGRTGGKCKAYGSIPEAEAIGGW